MEASSKLKYVRQSPFKVRFVADMIRGKNVADIDSVVGFDFGGIQGGISNILEWLEADNSVNLGTVASPSSKGVDLGSI